MGYAALGQVRPEWIPALKDYYLHFSMPHASLFTLGEKVGLVSLDFDHPDSGHVTGENKPCAEIDEEGGYLQDLVA